MRQFDTRILIREAIPDDAIDVSEVFAAAFAPLRSIYRPTSEAEARQAERANEGTRLVAEINQQIVGTVQFASHTKHVHVIGLAVHPDFHRRGVARRMIEWIVTRTPSFGHNIVALETIKETGNVPMFEELGFKVVREAVATWCISDNYTKVHDVTMERNVA